MASLTATPATPPTPATGENACEKIEPNTSGSAPAFTMTTTKAPMMYATVMSGTKRSEKRPIRRRPPSTTRAVSTAIAPVTTYGLMS